MKYIQILFFITILVSCTKKKKENGLAIESNILKEATVKKGQEVSLEIYDFNGFEKFLNQKDDKVYVINFWATWCGPCVKELPYFEKLNKEYASKNVEVILVSLDFPHLYESKLKPFIVDRKLKSKVIVLNDVDMNTWIPKVSEDWSGSIPATVIYRNDNYKFYEQSFDYLELEIEILGFLQ